MQFFFFDTETSGFMNAGGRIIQMGAIYGKYDQATEKFHNERIINQYINIDSEISPGAFAIHGITKEDLSPFKKMDAYIKEFLAYISKSDYVVCHNVKFDVPFLQSECDKYGIQFDRSKVKTFCTMNNNVIMDYMGVTKWPKLKDLHQFIFNKGFDDAHDAMADITATRDCFLELYRQNKIVLF